MSRNNQQGFTIIELAIATMVFAMVLLLITFGLLQIGKAFTKSVNEAKTQEAARTIADDISSTIKFNGEEVKPLPSITGASGDTVEGYCAGRKRYSFIKDKQLGTEPGQLPNLFVAEFMEESCTNATAPRDISIGVASGDEAIEMLGPNMQLDKFSITDGGAEGFHNINVRVIFGGDSEFKADPSDATGDTRLCDPSIGSTQFCAFSELSTSVQKRVE